MGIVCCRLPTDDNHERGEIDHSIWRMFQPCSGLLELMSTCGANISTDGKDEQPEKEDVINVQCYALSKAIGASWNKTFYGKIENIITRSC